MTVSARPDAAAKAHSQRLYSRIRDEMNDQDGKLSFHRFMELVLYEPGLGYYSAGASKLGEAGDFVTAPEISPLFSRCIARQCHQVLGVLGDADILEVGAGSGSMACEILIELERTNALPGRYFILDISADLRARQGALIRQRIPHLAQRVHWLYRLPGKGFRGVVLANEILDAMPVHRVHIGKNDVQEYCVKPEDDRFVWCLQDLTRAQLQQRTGLIRAMLGKELDEAGYTTEINLAAESWIGNISDMLESGLALIIDYGFPRREYYHPERSEGTLMCHYRHHAHADPLVNIGLQDITAHIDFTAIAEAACITGLNVAGFTNQAYFLLGCGLLDIAGIPVLERAGQQSISDIRQAQEIKKLTLPHEMGELFKVLALTRAIDVSLLGFTLRDDRGRL